MKLDSVRCGCGTVYRPMVRTQQACEACGARQREVARAQLGEQPQQYGSETHKWRTLVAGTGITISYEGPTVIGGPGIVVTDNQVLTVEHKENHLDYLGRQYNLPRELVFKDSVGSHISYQLATLETDGDYGLRLYKHMTT